MQSRGDWLPCGRVWPHSWGAMAKLVWRVKLIAELESGSVSETEVACIERDDFTLPETLGLTLDKGKRLMAATQAEVVRAQVSTMDERFRWCEPCGAKLLSKGYYPATLRSPASRP